MSRHKKDDKKEIILDFILRYILRIKDRNSIVYKEFYKLINKAIEEYYPYPNLYKELENMNTKIYYLNKLKMDKINKLIIQLSTENLINKNDKLSEFRSFISSNELYFIIEDNKEIKDRYNLVYLAGDLIDIDNYKRIIAIGSFILEKDKSKFLVDKIIKGNVFLTSENNIFPTLFKINSENVNFISFTGSDIYDSYVKLNVLEKALLDYRLYLDDVVKLLHQNRDKNNNIFIESIQYAVYTRNLDYDKINVNIVSVELNPNKEDLYKINFNRIFLEYDKNNKSINFDKDFGKNLYKTLSIDYKGYMLIDRTNDNDFNKIVFLTFNNNIANINKNITHIKNELEKEHELRLSSDKVSSELNNFKLSISLIKTENDKEVNKIIVDVSKNEIERFNDFSEIKNLSIPFKNFDFYYSMIIYLYRNFIEKLNNIKKLVLDKSEIKSIINAIGLENYIDLQNSKIEIGNYASNIDNHLIIKSSFKKLLDNILEKCSS